MKVLKRLSRMFCVVLVFTMLCSMSVFATEGGDAVSDTEITVGKESDTGNAVQDILMDDRFEGAMSSIKWLTDLIDHYFIQIISVVAFFIISAALLKNVCAGAYCANSKFWDKVDDAHKKSEAISLQQSIEYFRGKQFMQTNAGGIRDFLLGIIPNIKAFTDFEDADIEPKAYFMKAIPQMIACVFIGIFIYNGYYRDTAAKAGDMGAVLISKTLDSVNPESLVNTMFNMTSWPDFAWKGDPSEDGKAQLKIAEEVKSLVASNFSDVQSSQDKAEVVNAITAWVSSLHIPDKTSTADDEYIYRASGISGYVAADDANRSTETLISGTPGTSDLVYLFKVNLADIVPATTEMDKGNQFGYVRCTLKIDTKSDSELQASGVTAAINDTSETDEAREAIENTRAVVPLSKINGNGLNFTNPANCKVKLQMIDEPSTSFGIQPGVYAYKGHPEKGTQFFTDTSAQTVHISSGEYNAEWVAEENMYRIKIGRVSVEGGAEVNVYIWMRSGATQ